MTDTTHDHTIEVPGLIASLIHAIDLRQWGDAPGLLADEVVTDYRSLFGGEIQRQRGADLVAAWRTLLTPLDSTQHLLGPIDVRASNDGAVASCHVRAYHVRKGAPGATSGWSPGTTDSSCAARKASGESRRSRSMRSTRRATWGCSNSRHPDSVSTSLG